MNLYYLLASDDGGLGGAIKQKLNAWSDPKYFVTATVAMLVLALVTYRRWTKPRNAAALALLLLAFYVWSAMDPNFIKIIAKPDNVPITIMLVATAIVTWLAFRQAAINDERMERGEPLIESGADDKVLVWPDLV